VYARAPLLRRAAPLDLPITKLFRLQNVATRRRDRIKILYWDRDGFAVWAKRLEEGTYAMPFGDSGMIGGEKRREITAGELAALLSGIDLSRAKRRKRYVRHIAEAA